MSNLILLIRSQILKLSPFFNSLLVYFILVEEGQNEWWTTVLKCAPILFLMLYIYLKGFDFSKYYYSSQRILLGLACSCVGDALLNIDLFPHGMAAFGLAQIFYISAFGWKPLKWKIGIPLYIIGIIMVSIFFQNLRGLLVIGVPIYSILLTTMCWRALARVHHSRDILSVFCAVGSILFVISDSLIAIDRFIIKIPYSGALIMTAYYIAQFAFALSTASECSVLKYSSRPIKKIKDNFPKGTSFRLGQDPKKDTVNHKILKN